MSAFTDTRPARYADIEALPAHMVGQTLFGVLHAHSRPAPRYARAATNLLSEVHGPFDRGRGGPGGWIILVEPEVHLENHVVVPDIAGWRRARLPKLPETAWFDLEPDWVCEILSPATARIDRTDKLAIYAEFGASHVWLIDPGLKTLEVLALTNGASLLVSTFKDNDTVATPPFAAHEFPLDGLWQDT